MNKTQKQQLTCTHYNMPHTFGTQLRAKNAACQIQASANWLNVAVLLIMNLQTFAPANGDAVLNCPHTSCSNKPEESAWGIRSDDPALRKRNQRPFLFFLVFCLFLVSFFTSFIYFCALLFTLPVCCPPPARGSFLKWNKHGQFPSHVSMFWTEAVLARSKLLWVISTRAPHKNARGAHSTSRLSHLLTPDCWNAYISVSFTPVFVVLELIMKIQAADKERCSAPFKCACSCAN